MKEESETNVYQLDAVDRGVLYALQRNARDATAAEIAREVEVSASTVRNRIENLEDTDIIEGYWPAINYELAGYQLRVLFVASVPVDERATLAESVLSVPGVVDVRELLSGHENLFVEAVATSTHNLTGITRALSEQGLEIESSEIVTNHLSQPFGELEFDA